MIQRENDGVRWELQPDFSPLLDALLKSPGETVKESAVKQVTMHQVGEKTYYIKRYLHHAVPLRSLKFYFKATQARQEWDLALQLEARKIPIVRHVGLGERWTWSGVQESILVTEGFDGAQLDEMEGIAPALVKAFIERMHVAGVLQMDLHPANLLVGRYTKEMRLVDLHGTVVRDRLKPAEREENLAILRGYVSIDVPERVRKLSVRLRRRHIWERSHRCLRSNRDFSCVTLGGLKWQQRAALVDAQAIEILRGPDGFLDERAKPLKRGRSATVGAGGGFVLKRYNLRRLSRLVKDLFRTSPAYASFRKAYHLELLHIPTARPVAAAEKRLCRFLLKSYFLMEEIPGAVSLEARLRDGPELDQRLIESVGHLLGRLHGEGFSHRDLKSSNIILDSSEQPRLIDLDGLTFIGELPSARAKTDLERIARSVATAASVGRRQRIRFLRAYLRSRSELG